MAGTDMTVDYRFDDFTESRYADLVELARARYRFEPFGTDHDESHVLWRHDVDLSVHRAARLAEIETAQGVRATYFFQLHSEFYNLLERRVLERARAIAEAGHWCGLHFDLSFAPTGATGLEERLADERDLLSSALGTKVAAFSFHNPEVGGALEVSQPEVAGMVNAYGAGIRRDYRYVSDSSGFWRFDRIDEVLRSAPPRLHVLTHPEWWPPVAMSPRDRMMRCVEGRAAATATSYDRQLAEMRRENIRGSDG